MKRRQFLKSTGGVLAASAAVTSGAGAARTTTEIDPTTPEKLASPDGHCRIARAFNGLYQGEFLNEIAFPLGGIGAGMFCVEGTGTLSKFSLHHRPDDRERQVFAAISIRGEMPRARVLEGPVPARKLHPQFPGQDGTSCCWGLPRFHEASFEARFPFATVRLNDAELPLEVTLTAWSPFSPGDADNASLPIAVLEYTFANHSRRTLEAVFTLGAENILAAPAKFPPDPTTPPADRIQPTPGGFILYGAGTKERPWDEGHCAMWIDHPHIEVNHAWTLGSLDIEWRRFAAGEHSARAPLADRSAKGASLYLTFLLAPGETRTIPVNLAWYVPDSNVYEPTDGISEGKPVSYPRPADKYKPWYAGRFRGIEELIQYWQVHSAPLRQASERFSRAFHDSTLPAEALEAVAANLSILKSSTLYRQMDGRLWGWEGSTPESEGDVTGISGTSTHVWNYAQAVPHLFPALERTLREVEFESNQDDEGLQYCRTPLPIRPVEPGHTLPDGPAADGQLGGIIKVFREWRISGDTQWLRKLWPRISSSLNYCIRTWDPAQGGGIEEPHLTTYDMEFWGADSFCTSLYVGALQAAILMSRALGEPDAYSTLLRKAVQRMETELFNGDYFFQKTDWKSLRATFPPRTSLWRTLSDAPAGEWASLETEEGPPGQYGIGCLADGVMGAWLSLMSGLQTPLDKAKIASHLDAVYRYNLKCDLTSHPDLVRTLFACGPESGLVACSWPKGGRPTIPMVYSDEVWTGIEYQVASHLIALGRIDSGLTIVRAIRARYDGRVRNPFCEIEAGYWYARAMSSYALLQAFSGVRFDAVDKVLYLKPAIKGDFRCFLATATGFGTVGVKNGQPFLEVVSGTIPHTRIEYQAAA